MGIGPNPQVHHILNLKIKLFKEILNFQKRKIHILINIISIIYYFSYISSLSFFFINNFGRIILFFLICTFGGGLNRLNPLISNKFC